MQSVTSPQYSARLLRNATLILKLGGQNFLVDPMFGEKGSWDPIPWTNETRNPTVDLPVTDVELKKIVNDADYVLVTHLHPDHWDQAAQQSIPKDKPVICQPEDVPQLKAQGFEKLYTDTQLLLPSGVSINRVGAQHGHGDLAEKMAPASGYILKSNDRCFYLAGDSVWFEGVQHVIDTWQPDVIIVNGGGAKFQFGEPITMTADEVLMVANHSKEEAKVIVVHLEAVNHCYTTRYELQHFFAGRGLSSKVIIPKDGEELSL